MTSIILSDLRAVAHHLDDKTITSRKNHDEKLRSMLSNKRNVAALNEATLQDKGGGSTFTWTSLFKAVLRYVHSEVDRMKTDLEKSSLSSSSASSSSQLPGAMQKKAATKLQKLKLEPFSLLQLVIKIANRGQPMIRCDVLVDDMINCLSLDHPSNGFFRNHAGGIAIHIIRDRVLSDPISRCQIRVGDSNTGNQWKTLLNIAFQIFRHIPDGLDFNSCVQFFRSVVIYSCQFNSTRNFLRTKLSDLEAIMKSPKLAQSPAMTKSLFLEAVNRIMTELSNDYRALLCTFGESVMTSVLSLCGEDRNIDENLVKFVILQIALHHPDGATTVEQGAMFSDQKNWQHSLSQIYNNLIDSTIHNQQRTNRTKSVKILSLRQDLIELAALVSRQIFLSQNEAEGSEMSITQFVPHNVTQHHSSFATLHGDNDDRPATKRRKVQLGFDSSILEKLSKQEKFEENYFPWLQIIEKILIKYSASVLCSEQNVDKILAVLKSVLDLLQTCRDLEVKELLLRCANLILAIPHHQSPMLEQKIGSEFVKLWETALNIVSLNQCVKDGHTLIRTMLAQASSEQVAKLYGLFLNKLIVCNEDSIETLLVLLIHSQQIPETNQNLAGFFSSQSLTPTKCPGSDSGRMALLDWLWQRNKPQIEHKETSAWVCLRKDHSRLIGALLTIFSVRVESDQGRQFLLAKVGGGFKNPAFNSKSDFEQFLSQMEDLERILIETSLLPSETKTTETSSYTARNSLSVISRMKLAIHEKLVQESGEISSLLSEKNKSREEIFADCLTAIESAHFNIIFLRTFHQWGISQTDEKSRRMTNRMIDIYQGVIEKTCSILNHLLSNSNTTTFGTASFESQFQQLTSAWVDFLRDLKKFVKVDQRFKSLIETESFAHMFTVVHQNVALSFATNLHEIVSNIGATNVGSTQNKTLVRNEPQNEDIEFMDEEESRDSNSTCLLDETEDFCDNDAQEVEIKSLENIIRCALLLLSEISSSGSNSEQTKIIVQTLIQYFKNFEKVSRLNPAGFTSLNRFSLKTLFKVLDTILTEKPFPMEGETVLEVLKLLQNVARLYLRHSAKSNLPSYFDPTICSLVMQALAQILHHISIMDEITEASVQSARKNYVIFVLAFVKMQSDTAYQMFGRDLECRLVNLIGEIARIDPTGKWASWSGKIHNICSRDDRESAADPEDKIAVSSSLLRFVMHPSHEVRVAALKNLVTLFTSQANDIKIQELSDLKRKMLSQLYEHLLILCNVTFSADEAKFSVDERRTRYATILLSLSAIALNYPSLEREAVARILAPLNTFQIPLKQLKLVFEHLARTKMGQAATTSNYLEPILPFILKEFLKQDKPWNDFPYQLLGCDTLTSFAAKYEKFLLPILLWYGKSDRSDSNVVEEKLVELSNNVGKEGRQLLTDNFSDLASYFLPIFVANDKNPEILKRICSKKRINRSKQIHGLCDKVLSTKKYFSLLNEFIPEILSKILMQVQDPEEISASLTKDESLEQNYIENLLTTTTSSDPPSSNAAMVKNLIQYFGEIVTEGIPLFSYLAATFPDSLQRILQDICVPLKSNKKPDVQSKIRALHGLNIWVDCLQKELSGPQISEISKQLPFVSLYLLHTLLDFVTSVTREKLKISASNCLTPNSETKIFSPSFETPILNWEESALCIFVALQALKKVCGIAFTHLDDSNTKRLALLLGNSLIPMISDLDELCSQNGNNLWSTTIVNIRNVSLNVLTVTLLTSLGSFDPKQHLDPFPKTSNDIFSQLSQSLGVASNPQVSDNLSGIIGQFVEKGKISFCGTTKTLHRKEGLSRLLHSLQMGRKELKGMLAKLANGQGLAEDAADSLLHQLIIQLIDLTKSKNVDISEMASKCLGEIGPLNLNTLLLNPRSKFEPRSIFIVRLLLEYIVHDDEATSSAAALALKYVLQTAEGKDSLVGCEDEELNMLVAPFFSTISSATFDPNTLTTNSNTTNFDLSLFTSLIDNEDLWSGEHGICSDQWICNIVKSLLDTLPLLKMSQFKSSSILGRHLATLCTLQPQFSQEIFPLVMHDLLRRHLTSGEAQVRKVLSDHVNLFFKKHFVASDTTKSKAPYNDIRIVRMMLSMCGHLRLCDIPANDRDGRNATAEKMTVWQNNFWLHNLDYLHLAKAALYCSDYFSVILFADIWCQRVLELHPDLEKRFAVCFDSSNLLNFLHENLQNKNEILQDVKACQTILAEAHQNLGDLDAIHGCGDDRLLDNGARIQQLINENKLYKAMGMFDEILATENSRTKTSVTHHQNVQYEKGLMFTLLGTGFYHTMSSYITGSKLNPSFRQNMTELQNYQYECAWRLGQWDSLGDEDTSKSKKVGSAFSRHRYLALDSLLGENGNEPEFVRHLRLASLDVGSELSRLKSCETACSSIASPLAKLRALRELEVICELMPRIGKGHEVDRDLMIRVTENLEQLGTYSSEILFSTETSDFDNSEPILAQRCIALSQMSLRQRLDHVTESPVKRRQVDLLEVRKETTKAYTQHALQLCQAARQNDRFQIAHNSLNRLKQLVKDVQSGGKFANILDEKQLHNLDLEIRYEEALLLWYWKEKDHAKRQMKNLLQILQQQKEESGKCSHLLPEVLGTLGAWMYELRTESAASIMDTYLIESVRLFETLLRETCNQDKMVDAYANLAKFCDDQHEQLAGYMKSKDFEDKQILMAQIREESNSIKNIGTSAKDNRQATAILDRNSAIDNSEVDALKKNKLRYLLGALKNYCNALKLGTKHDLKTFRLISLWFSNISDETVNKELYDWLSIVPSYKFVGLLYQLCARMVLQSLAGVHASTFPEVLIKLICRCAKDHPYHALPIILALANSDADQAEIDAGQTGGKPVQKRFRDETANGNGSSSNRSKNEGVKEERTLAANQVLMILKKSHLKLVVDMDNLSNSLIKLAYTSDGKKNPVPGGKVPIERSHSLRKIIGFENVPVPTLNIEVNPNCQYLESSFVGVVQFSQEFSNVGGINAPKKISCLGSDGKWRPQLVKGKDDLRQDAVMQQVFGLMNTLLRNDPKTTKRRLQIRQYKVVPLSQRSGILEWCDNTMVMKDFLIGENNESGAHQRYHPNDLTAPRCRKALAEAQAKNQALKVFLDLCSRFKPAMKYFFFENFPSPGLYIEKRLAYSRSTATSSMIGYILGLGDRHVQNILIDKQTAEMIHIDLGIAFEQGKILPTPETVPFRLTRDVVDGLGPSGVEGTFRMCCEATMKVLRSHKDEVMTILEVMMFDPLYNWSLTPAKAYRLQNGKEADSNLKKKWEDEAKRKREMEGKANDKGSNKMAERVLLRVSQKLNGSEEGSYLSIEGQVNSLIQQARDPQNLCSLFVGWQAYI